MNGRPGSQGTLERHRKLGTSVWVWYLATGAVLAATRIALLVWLNHRLATHVVTSMDDYLFQLYPDAVVFAFGGQALLAVGYYLTLGTLLSIGSFVMATPILLVGWLRRRRTSPRPSR